MPEGRLVHRYCDVFNRHDICICLLDYVCGNDGE
jgi:hypothetical protein